jgi:hypothetical protein
VGEYAIGKLREARLRKRFARTWEGKAGKLVHSNSPNWQAPRDSRHGKDRALRAAEAELFAAVGAPSDVSG